MTKNICIIGAGGQLGSKLLETLSKNQFINIFAIDKVFNNKLSSNNIKYISLDIKDSLEKEFIKIPNENTIFINCVGLQHALLSQKIIDVNYKLNKKLIDFIVSNYSNFKFIHISSLSVDSRNIQELALGVGSPINLYGKSKLMFEKYLLQNVNEKITVIRPAAFYDFKLSKNLVSFFDLLINKIFFLPIKNIHRSFLSLDYFCKYLEQYILSDDHVEILEIADELPVEFNTLIELIKDSEISVNSKIVYLPKFLFKTAGFIGYSLEKIGLHIGFLTILGEFGYDFVSSKEPFSYKINKDNTYENFINIIKRINSE
jgi:nucleoside-diphosphate-sugar epimerase